MKLVLAALPAATQSRGGRADNAGRHERAAGEYFPDGRKQAAGAGPLTVVYKTGRRYAAG